MISVFKQTSKNAEMLAYFMMGHYIMFKGWGDRTAAIMMLQIKIWFKITK